MTTTYEATDRSCIECGAPVEDYTGHWEASEVTLCEECYDEHVEEWRHRAEVVHKVPQKEDDSPGTEKKGYQNAPSEMYPGSDDVA